MTLKEAIAARHSVRQYTGRPLTKDQIDALNAEIAECNREGDLNIQLVLDEPKAFKAEKPHYGQFKGVRNYIALIGKKGSSLDERLGYYGERIVLLAQTLGLNTCWVGLTFSKTPEAMTIGKGEKLCAVIAIGFGEAHGVSHKIKRFDDVVDGQDFPEWFRDGVDAALLAPTAMNQQKFKFSMKDGSVSAKAGLGFFAKMDLGIVKCHFEIASGHSFPSYQA